MNTNFRAVVLLLLLIGIGKFAFAQTVTIKDPIKYNDYMVEQQELFTIELLNLIDMFGDLPEDKAIIDGQLQKVVEVAKSGLAAQNALKPLPNDMNLHKAATDLFEFYIKTLQNEYVTIINELYESIPDLDKMDSIVLQVQNDEAVFDEAFNKAQTNFAAKHNFRLLKNELQDEIDNINE